MPLGCRLIDHSTVVQSLVLLARRGVIGTKLCSLVLIKESSLEFRDVILVLPVDESLRLFHLDVHF